MPASAEAVRNSVFAAIESYNATEEPKLASDVGTVLMGAGGTLDSLGLVRFIMLVERRLEDDLGTPVSLTDEKAMSQRNSPFRTVGTLVDYAASVLGAAQ